MTETSPYHIIEVDCTECSGTGDVVKDYCGCADCNRTGKRRRAVWQLENQPYNKNPNRLQRSILIREQSPYQSNTDLPTGETLEQVELMQANDLMKTPYKSDLSTIQTINSFVNTLLCTALIKEQR